MTGRPCLMFVAGARPNFMKIAPLAAAAKRRGGFEIRIVHTGQHYDEGMSEKFFRELGIPPPDDNLGVGSDSHARQTAAIMTGFEAVLLRKRPHVAVVVGDVNSTIACALVAVKEGVPVAHVEAGLRSFDRTMPEEINRLLTDAVSDFLFVTERAGIANLDREGIDPGKIHFTGNVMIDTLLAFRERAKASDALDRLGLAPRAYAPVTLHRPSNVDAPGPLARILDAFEEIGRSLKLVWPLHPRTAAAVDRFGLRGRLEGIRGLIVAPPLGYIDFLRLQSEAAVVITDSGGIQEEATILKVPCVTLRENTERPSTVECGGNVLVGGDRDAIVREVRRMANLDREGIATPPLWDGAAAVRIIDILGKALRP